jgi:preprotein translocase subunit SecF
VGVYSTIFIASPLTIWLDERAAAKEARQGNRIDQHPKTA